MCGFPQVCSDNAAWWLQLGCQEQISTNFQAPTNFHNWNSWIDLSRSVPVSRGQTRGRLAGWRCIPHSCSSIESQCQETEGREKLMEAKPAAVTKPLSERDESASLAPRTPIPSTHTRHCLQEKRNPSCFLKQWNNLSLSTKSIQSTLRRY